MTYLKTHPECCSSQNSAPLDNAERLIQFAHVNGETVFTELAQALRERRAVIADHALREHDAAAHLEKLKAASERIMVVQARLPREIDPQLRHYLERCSYDKALAHLDSAVSRK